MIKENIYEKITLNELKAQAKTVKTMISIFSGILLVLVFATVFLSFRQGFYPLSILFIQVALFPIFFGMLKNLNNTKKEIKFRES
jgi:accessory gene regulator protein AgrB